MSKKKKSWIWTLIDWVLSFAIALLIMVAGIFYFYPDLIHSHDKSVGCKSSLIHLGTAMKMYSADFDGHYPRSLSLLTPNYLKSLPECPVAGGMNYRVELGPQAPMNKDKLEEYFVIECVGAHHIDLRMPEDPKYDPDFRLPPDYPKYNSVDGLIDGYYLQENRLR
jgi:hypothetical protein